MAKQFYLTQKVTTNPSQSERRINGSEGVLHISPKLQD